MQPVLQALYKAGQTLPTNINQRTKTGLTVFKIKFDCVMSLKRKILLLLFLFITVFAS